MNWIFLSLLAPLFWASSNFIDKYILGKHSKGIFDFLFFSTITSWFLFAALFIFIGVPHITAYSLIPIVTGIMLVYSYGFYGKALERGDTSTLVILFKFTPVVTAILAFIFLGQTLSSRELLGFVIVLMGTVVVSLEGRKKLLIHGFLMIVIAIVMWSVVSLFADYGLTKIPFWDYIMLDAFGAMIAGLALFIIPSIRAQVIDGLKIGTIRKHVWFFGNNILDIFAQTIIKGALAIAPSAGLVAVVTQVQSFYAIVIGMLLTLFVPNSIQEDISVSILIKKCIGALVMFFGVYVLLV